MDRQRGDRHGAVPHRPHAVVAARGAVVRADVAPYTKVAGVPAKVVGRVEEPATDASAVT